ncbi:hypothetical protein MAJHIDBO_01147 [Propionibacterium freudenreichii subsp. shermanii]|nr:hypothetical protein MAJHIDBO_01147 [Propionibacterium freudenreichii subsp. shermanii]SPS08942.1 hypothetical protein MAJHIDBO_01147 [Propionibacterium freudenreichii subsp. shermanii]
MPIWLACSTCVPAHSSRLQGPPISTTRTMSGYFSPNIAMAPMPLACASGICVALTSRSSRIAALQRASISAFRAADRPWEELKSKRR